ncbi:MAG: hypothetical protein CM15mP22_6140 [Gammaproteobacteria bacterium]|nr:MAG: hypothetical protein CM15mP22_6140 [Gammaproteobacteria bacterium]
MFRTDVYQGMRFQRVLRVRKEKSPKDTGFAISSGWYAQFADNSIDIFVLRSFRHEVNP